MTKFLTYREIEKIYGLKKNTLSKKFSEGKFIPAVKIGNRNYFEVYRLDQWIQSNSIDISSKLESS